MTSTSLTQSEIMRELEHYKPSQLRQKLEHEISRVKSAPETDSFHDPIMSDLLKIQGRTLPTLAADRTADTPEYSIEQLSLRLRELLELVLDPTMPDDARMHHELALKEMISREPRTKTGPKSYPNDYLSRILIDNYTLFLKISTSYFNLSFASLVTRYLVSIIYNLECWEIYHLLHSVPNLEYILKLLEFEIQYTSFGYVVKPPDNYLNFNLRQGLQYPYPFPFYNFSYHSLDPMASEKKLERISVKPYIDLRLEKRAPKPQTKQKSRASSIRSYRSSNPDLTYVSDSDSSADSEDFRRWKIVYLFVEMTPEKIQRDFDLCFVSANQRAYEEEDYDSDRAQLIEAKEQESIDDSVPGLPMTPSVFQKAFTKANNTGLVKHTFLHQCKLMDPASHKTCLKVFYGKNELHRHQEFVHATKKRMYRCVYCPKEVADDSNKVYPRYDSLARHIRRKHGIVGTENKSAVLLARRAAEAEDIFGKQPNFVGEGTGETMAGSPSGIRASLSVTSGAARRNSEKCIVGAHSDMLQEVSVRPEPHKKARKQSAQEEPRERKKKASVSGEPGPSRPDAQGVSYGEFRPFSGSTIPVASHMPQVSSNKQTYRVSQPSQVSHTQMTQNPQSPRNTQAPQSQVPQSQAPQSQVPQSQAPQSQAPQSQAPHSQAPRNAHVLKSQMPHYQVSQSSHTPEPSRISNPHLSSSIKQSSTIPSTTAIAKASKLAQSKATSNIARAPPPSVSIPTEEARRTSSANIFAQGFASEPNEDSKFNAHTHRPEIPSYAQPPHQFGAFPAEYASMLNSVPENNMGFGHAAKTEAASQSGPITYPYMDPGYASMYIQPSNRRVSQEGIRIQNDFPRPQNMGQQMAQWNMTQQSTLQQNMKPQNPGQQNPGQQNLGQQNTLSKSDRSSGGGNEPKEYRQ